MRERRTQVAAADHEWTATVFVPMEFCGTHMKTRRASDRREPGASRTTLVAEGVIEAGWLFSLVVVPLFFNVYSARSFEPDKIALFRSIVIVMLGAWLFKAATRGRLYVRSGRAAATSVSPHTDRARPYLIGAAVAVLAVWVVTGAALSVDPGVAWFGSYTRFSGAWTHLAFFVFFALTAAHFRSRRQWRRAAFAIVLAAAAVAAYAVLQALGLDPRWFPFSEARVYSTLGNPIFLAAYLGITLFVTYVVTIEMVRQRQAAKSGARGSGAGRGANLRLVALGSAGVLQFVAMVLSQSRGPLVGFVAGAYVVALLTAGALRLSHEDDPGLPRRADVGWFATVALAVLGVGVLISFAASDALARSVEDVPVVGRISQAFDVDASPARLEIWRSVERLLVSAEPISAPGQSVDSLAGMRPVIGYGPDTLELVIGRHVTDELASLEAVSDRSHNATFDALATQGAVGYALWLLVYGGVFMLSLRAVGLVDSPQTRRSAFVFVGGGAAAGVVLPALLSGGWALSGVGIAVGAVAGLVLLVTLRTAPWRIQDGTEPASRYEYWLSVAILGAMVSHVVEIHFGILVSPTRLMFWFLAAVLVSISMGPLESSPLEAEPATASKPGSRRRASSSARLESPKRESTVWDRREALILGWLIAAAVAPFTYAMTVNEQLRNWFSDVLSDAFLARYEATAWGPGAYFWIVVVVFSIGAALLGSAHTRSRDARPIGWGLQVGAALAFGYAVFQAFRVAAVVTRQQTDIRGAVDYSLGHGTWFVALVLVSVVVVGATIGFQQRPADADQPVWRIMAAASLLGVVAVLLVAQGNLAPIRADTLAQQGVGFSESGNDTLAVEALENATRLWPREPRYWLLSGKLVLETAERAAAVIPLEAARDLRPLDPDHHANLGRFFVSEADVAELTTVQTGLLQQAHQHYRAALFLAPKSPILLREHIIVLRRLGRAEEADELAARLARIEVHRR
jgi:hypothetical protein